MEEIYICLEKYIIKNSKIDGDNNHRIINIQDPIDPQDLVTLSYLEAALLALQQNNGSGPVQYTIQLIADIPTNVVSLSEGAFVLKVKPDTLLDGPFATFHASKAQSSCGSVTRTSMSGGSQKLRCSWKLNEPIKIWKTLDAPDGDYVVTFV